MLLTLPEIKCQCRIDEPDEAHPEDPLLSLYAAAAENHIEQETQKKLVLALSDPTVESELLFSEDIKLIALLLVSHWYANREAVTTEGSAKTVPLTFATLIAPYKPMVIG